MKVRIFTYALLICFSLLNEVKGGPPNTVTIEFNFADKQMNGQKITLDYFRYYSFICNLSNTTTYTTEVKNSIARIIIKNTSNLGYWVIRTELPYKISNIWNAFYLVESGDKINIKIKNGKMTFSGVGSYKYTCQAKAESTSFHDDKLDGLKLDSNYVLSSVTSTERILSNKLKVLAADSLRLSPDVYSIIKLNLQSKANTSIINSLRIFRGQFNPSTLIDDLFFKCIKRMPESPSNNNVNLNSIEYLDFLFLKEISRLEFSSPQLIGSKNRRMLSTYSVYNTFLNSFNGPIRDRLLTATIRSEYIPKDSTDYYLDQALLTVKEPVSQEILTLYKNKFGRGAKAFNFHLQDTSQRMVSLSDFKGKLVIIDFYFTGCSGCIQLSKEIPMVLERFKGNTNLVYISINLDKTLNEFKQAVKSGKYTHPEYINLYTNGQGEEHEIVKYYEVWGCPKMIIIDQEGKILDSDPPLPYNGQERIDKFINIVSGALANVTPQ